jgi:hypothetical protein
MGRAQDTTRNEPRANRAICDSLLQSIIEMRARWKFEIGERNASFNRRRMNRC